MSTHPVFGPRFAAAALSELPLDMGPSWDVDLPRDPRLLVPVDVRALVVAPGETIEHAEIETRLLAVPPAGNAPVARQPDPFTDGTPRRPGVYLHWAMPDGLTHGRASGDAPVELRPLPNRWVVTRIEGGVRRRTRSWVLESERGRSVPLGDWSEQPDLQEGRTPGLPAEALTAMGGGDPAWAAVWDNVVDRFAFHDDLVGVEIDGPPLSYLIVGWYSVPELDPLHPSPGRPGFEQVLQDLGWSVDGVRLERVRAETARRIEAARTLRLESRRLQLSGPRSELDARGDVEPPLTATPPGIVDGADDIVIKSAPSAPTQSLYHGTIHGIHVNPGARTDPKPEASEIQLSVGGTGNESLASLVAAGIEGSSDHRELIERLQTAFGYGVVDAFDDVDALPQLEEELHQRAFGSEPGGFREERVRAGDALAELRGTRPGGPLPPKLVSLGEPGEVARRVAFEFRAARFSEVLDRFVGQTRPGRIAPPPEPLHYETVRRSLPRFYFPQDPVATLQGLGRSLRHGYDGRFEPDETVACRVSGDPVPGYDGLIDGEDLLETGIGHGGVPSEVGELLREAVVEDPFAVEEVASVAAERSGLPLEAVRARVEAERRALLRSMQAEADVRLAAASLKRGVLPSPVAMTPFAQAWVPLFLEWELELAVDASLERWALGELDLEPADRAAAEATARKAGRSLLTSSGAKAYAEQVDAFLDEERRLDDAGRGRVGEETAELLRTTAREAQWIDVLNATFEGLREHLLGFDTDVGASEADDVPAPPPAPSRPPTLLRGGTARLTRLRVVDAFGRFVELPAERLRELIVSESLQTPPSVTSPTTLPELLLPPRLMAPSRLLLRFLDAEDDAAEATLDQQDPAAMHSPIAAWLLPDHVDAALEVFDADGEPQGQLRHEVLASGVVWEGTPGQPEPLGTPPPPTLNRHATALAIGLVQRDAADRTAGAARDESPLSALLRAIDTTLWTVDPFGQSGREHFSLLVGRPIALVRAELRLEVRSDVDEYPQLDEETRSARAQAFRSIADRVFEVRLGALTRFDDGLLGYFVDDDYSRFFPVHAQIPEEALPSGPHAGFQGTVEEAASFQTELPSQPIRHPYIERDPTLSVRPGHSVHLTLLMDPSSMIHVTSGIVPRKSIALLRDWTSVALERIAPSFRLGPVLVDPQAIRLPKPSALPKDQAWTRRDTPTSWRDDPILAATQDASVPETAAVLEEGYVRVRTTGDGGVKQ